MLYQVLTLCAINLVVGATVGFVVSRWRGFDLSNVVIGGLMFAALTIAAFPVGFSDHQDAPLFTGLVLLAGFAPACLIVWFRTIGSWKRVTGRVHVSLGH